MNNLIEANLIINKHIFMINLFKNKYDKLLFLIIPFFVNFIVLSK